jgi:hypothetical protein
LGKRAAHKRLFVLLDCLEPDLVVAEHGCVMGSDFGDNSDGRLDFLDHHVEMAARRLAILLDPRQQFGTELSHLLPDFAEFSIDVAESFIDLIESCTDLIESCVDLGEPIVDPGELFVGSPLTIHDGSMQILERHAASILASSSCMLFACPLAIRELPKRKAMMPTAGCEGAQKLRGTTEGDVAEFARRRDAEATGSV